jgi:8-oxo-dGTP pyrophosphatase MutT (NUDIX family)
MEFKNKDNTCYDTTCGKKVWHSRNVATSTTIIRTKPENKTKIQILGVKRGPKVTNTGKYCFPCGYLDWDESVPQAAVREIYEETGLTINLHELDFVELDSSPLKFLQNVTVHFVHYYVGSDEPHLRNSAEGEVDEVRWIDFEEAMELDWAFDHKLRIKTLIRNMEENTPKLPETV